MRTSFFCKAFFLFSIVFWSKPLFAQCEEHRTSYYSSINKAVKAGIASYQETLTERRLENDAARILVLSIQDAKDELPGALEDLKGAEENGGYGEVAAEKYRICQLEHRIAVLSRSGSNIGGKFGALAIDKNHGNSFGWAVSFPSEANAADRALSECKSRASSECFLVMRFNDTCATYAVDATRSSTAYGWAWGRDKAIVDNRAIQECTRRGGSGSQCVVRVWGCNNM